MDSAVEGGRVEVVVVGDTTGFARELQRKVDAALRGVRAVVAVTADAKGLRREVAKAARVASAGATVEVRTKVAADRLRDEVGRYVADAEARTRAARVGIDVDGKKVRGDVARLVAELERNRVDLEVRARTDRARADVERVRDDASGGPPVKIPLVADDKQFRRGVVGAQRDVRGLGRSMGSIKVPAVAATLNLAVAAAASLAAGTVALAGGLQPVVGLLGAIPGVAAGAAAGFIATAVAASGLGDAVGALVDRQRGGVAATKSAVSSARAQEAAAERVSDAQRRVAEAVRSAADAQVAASRRVRDANQELSSAQRAARRAQEDVNRAREEAAERLRDLRLELSGAALDEEAAQLALERALKEREAVERSVTATELDRREAELSVGQAEQRLAEIRERNADLNEEAADLIAKDIDQADAVVEARERQQEAELALREAMESVADARKDQRDASRDAVVSVAEAREDLARALRDAQQSADSTAGGVDKVRQSMEGLPPSAQRFARILAGYLPLVDRLRAAAADALFPRLETALGRLVRLAGPVERALAVAAGAVGDVAVAGATMVSSGPFAADFAIIAEQNGDVIRGIGGVLLSLLDAMRHVAVAAEPMLDGMISGAQRLADGLRDSAEAGRESGSLAEFFDRALRVGRQLLRIVGNTVVGVARLADAGSDLGGDMLDSLERITERFAEFTASTSGRNRLVAYFEDVRPVLEAVGRLAGDLFRAIADRAASPQLAPLIEQLRVDLLPALLNLADTASQRLLPTLIDLVTAFANLKAELPLDPFITVLSVMAELVDVFAVLLRNVPGFSTFVALFVTFAAAAKTVSAVGKFTGITSLVNGLSGRGNTALANFVKGLRGADSSSKTLAGRLGGRVVPALKRVRDLMAGGARAAADLALSLGRSATAFLVNAAATARATIATLVHRAAIVAGTIATNVMAAAQAALNFVMALNPIGLLVIAIGVLIAGLVVLYRRSEAFRNIINAAFGAVVRAGGAVVSFIRRNWPALLGILTGPFGALIGFVARNFDRVKSAARSVKEFILTAFTNLKNGLARTADMIGTAITRPFEIARDVVRSAINYLLDGLRAALRAIGRIRITLPRIPGVDIPGIPDGAVIGLPDLSGMIPSLAEGAIALPRPGGHVVRVAEARKPEIIGPLDKVADLLGAGAGGDVVFEQGAFVVNNPVPEPASVSINVHMRRLRQLGVFGGARVVGKRG